MRGVKRKEKWGEKWEKEKKWYDKREQNNVLIYAYYIQYIYIYISYVFTVKQIKQELQEHAHTH